MEPDRQATYAAYPRAAALTTRRERRSGSTPPSAVLGLRPPLQKNRSRPGGQARSPIHELPVSCSGDGSGRTPRTERPIKHTASPSKGWRQGRFLPLCDGDVVSTRVRSDEVDLSVAKKARARRAGECAGGRAGLSHPHFRSIESRCPDRRTPARKGRVPGISRLSGRPKPGRPSSLNPLCQWRLPGPGPIRKVSPLHAGVL